MISDIRIDFSELKSILIDVIKENRDLIDANENIVLQVLYKGYEPKINIDDTRLRFYTKKFEAFYGEKCKKLAKSSLDEENGFDKQEMYKLEQEGEVFKSEIFNVFKNHLYIESCLNNGDNPLLIAVVDKLIHHIGNAYYFDVDKSNLKNLFRNALLLYLCDKRYSSIKDVEVVNIVKSMKRLLRLKNFEYSIEYGDIYFSENAEKDIQAIIEKLVEDVGAIDFLQYLFVEYILPKYNSQLDRFLIHRNMKQIIQNITDIRIPYNYLIQLSAKHINKFGYVIITNKGRKEKYNKIIELSSDYLNVLNLQSYSIFGDMIYDYKSIPVKLSRNILFEKMFTPIQYRPDFVIKYLKEVYFPFFDNVCNSNIGYNKKEYMKFCEFILYEKRICVSYTFDELKLRTNINRTALIKILEDVSVEYDKVNSDFYKFIDETNYRLKPLIKLQNDKYFLFSAYFNGFSFCEVLYYRLYYPGAFNKIKGENVEDMVKKMFIEKGFQFHSGIYYVDSSKNYDCDMVLETDKHIIFFEIKNQPLPDTFEQGDDIETLRCLGEGMIKAQRQCYRHIYYLKEMGCIMLKNKDGIVYELKQKGRRIVCISICSQEYLFLTNKIFSMNFLQSLLISRYHATDPDKEKRLKNLNLLQDELEKLIVNIYDDIKLNNIFFNTLFRSAQQISTILNVSNSLDDFVDNLTEPIYISDGSGDVYNQLLTTLKIKNAK